MTARHAPAAPVTLNDLGVVGLRRLITERFFVLRPRDLEWAKYWEMEAVSQDAFDAWRKATSASEAAFDALLGAHGQKLPIKRRHELEVARERAHKLAARKWAEHKRAEKAAEAFYAAHLQGDAA